MAEHNQHFTEICICGKQVNTCRCIAKDKIIKLSPKPCMHGVNLETKLREALAVISQNQHDFVMYRNAWLREIGGRVIPKTHDIDALVLTTRAIVEERDRLRAELKKLADLGVCACIHVEGALVQPCSSHAKYGS